MTIEPRKAAKNTTRYRARVRLRGAKTQSQTFPTQEAARAWGTATEQTVRETRVLPEAARHTVGELLNRYRREVLPGKSRGTQRWQEAHLEWWHTRVGFLRLSELTPAVLVTCRQELSCGRSAGTTRSPGTVRGYLTTLTHALALAVREWQWLDVSPMARVTKPAAPRGRVRYLADDERKRLLEVCTESRHPALHLIVLLALATGCRKMELLGLRWADVDLSRGVLTLQVTKNGERRRVPLTGQALDLLTAWAKVRRLESSLVFPRADGRAPVDIRYAFAQALRQAGCELQKKLQIPSHKINNLRRSPTRVGANFYKSRCKWVRNYKRRRKSIVTTFSSQTTNCTFTMNCAICVQHESPAKTTDTQVCNFLHTQKGMCNEQDNRSLTMGKFASSFVIFASPFVYLHLLLEFTCRLANPGGFRYNRVFYPAPLMPSMT